MGGQVSSGGALVHEMKRGALDRDVIEKTLKKSPADGRWLLVDK